MLKTCLFRGCRIVFMLAVLFVFAGLSLFIVSPDVGFLEAYLESNIKKDFHVDKVDVENTELSWKSGPSFDMDVINISSDKLNVYASHVSLYYPIFNIFIGRFAPEVSLSGGTLKLNLDVEKETQSEPVNVVTNLNDVTLVWVLNGEQQAFEHVDATVLPFATDISFKADGVALTAKLRDGKYLEELSAEVERISGFPKSWHSYVTGLQSFKISVHETEGSQWSWKLLGFGDKGLISVDKAHFRLPFQSLEAAGDIKLELEGDVVLQQLNIDSLLWKDGENYGDFEMQWANQVLHIDAHDGSTSMPLLWSWLWKLGGDAWHDWLNSMHQGRIQNVRASLDLDWLNPLKAAPTIQNLIDMKYHVTAKASGVDMALGVGGDFLYDMKGDVLVDEKHLEADISHTVLKDNIATGYGKYRIDWDTLVMKINAKGEGDVARLHQWLDNNSAKELAWNKGLAKADFMMEWDAHLSEPNQTIVKLSPIEDWRISPRGIHITLHEGMAVWDYQKGLDLSNMQVALPWLEGELSLFLDKQKDWALTDASLVGSAPLEVLTESFVLPIIKPTGITKLNLFFNDGDWEGQLDLSDNDWESFAGYDKEGIEPLIIPIQGKQLGAQLLPIQLSGMNADHDGFSFQGSTLITKDRLDLNFTHIDTAAFRGDVRVLMPFDASLAWGLDVDAEYMDKPVLTRYLNDKGGSEAFTRPWSVNANIDWVEWEKTIAQDVYLRFSSDKTGVGEVSAGYLLSGDADLEKVKATFSLNGHGDYDLHFFEAHGAGQKLQASGSIATQKDGSLQWKGLALMDGKFGTLMEQAELDKLFQEGEMSGVFIGQGEFKDGEPWWRKLKGSFKLRVDDGRILEGGTLTHLLAAISIVDLPKYLIFDRGDVVGSGLLYEKMQVEGVFESNKLSIHSLGFLSSALDAGGKGEVDLETGNLDIVLVARPWQNIEVFLSKIPLLGHVLTGEDKSLKRAVYHIHGPASDAAVDEVNPEDVGLPKGGYLEDLFTPSKWFEPRKKKEEVVK